jgi:hypothetical protein
MKLEDVKIGQKVVPLCLNKNHSLSCIKYHREVGIITASTMEMEDFFAVSFGDSNQRFFLNDEVELVP